MRNRNRPQRISSLREAASWVWWHLLMRPAFRSRILVIGAGLAGLAAAIRLRQSGCEVTLVERNDAPGGKLRALEWEGFRWDTGPSQFTLPQVLGNLWESVGRKLKDDLAPQRLPVTCRYWWRDGTRIDEDAGFWQQPGVDAVVRHGRGVCQAGAGALLHRPIEEWRDHLAWRRPACLPHLVKLADPRPLSSAAARFFPRSPHLQQWLGWFAGRAGASPYHAPSSMTMLPFPRAEFGGWYVAGGMQAVAAALVRLARQLGVVVETRLEAVRFEANNDAWTVFLRSREGGPSSPRRCDGIVCTMDALAATRRFLDPGFQPQRPLSASGFVIQAAIGRDYPELAHDNVFFSQDFHAEFADLFGRLVPPDNPTLQVTVSSKTDPSLAPAGCGNWLVFVNAPPLQPKFDWTFRAQRYADRILGQLAEFGLEDPRPHVRWMKTTTPADFAARYLSPGGALHGYATHGLRAPLQRPAIESPLPGLVFAGAATHPGPGIPQALLSGQLAARALLRQRGGPDLELAAAWDAQA